MVPETCDPTWTVMTALIVPVALLVVLQGAAIVQLASLSHPLFGQRTIVGHGIDAIAQPSSESEAP